MNVYFYSKKKKKKISKGPKIYIFTYMQKQKILNLL